MKYTKGIFLLLLGLAQANFLLAHNVKEDLKKIYGVYSVHKAYSLKVIYRLFPDYQSVSSTEEKIGIIKKKDNLLYASYFGLEIIRNSRSSCVIDHNLKTITIEKAVKGSSQLLPDLDKSLKLYSAVSYDSVDSGHGMYTFSFRNSIYNKIEIEFNTKTFLIQRITYYYQKAEKVVGAAKAGRPKMDILFSDIETNTSFASNDFSTGKFFKKHGDKKYVLTPAYKGYKLEIKE